MLKFTKLLLPVALLAVMFQSCESDKEESQKLTVDEDSFTVDAKFQTATVVVTSSTDWAIEPNDSWLSAYPSTGGKGTTSVSIKIEENTRTRSRNGTLTASGRGISYTRTINVAQGEGKGNGGGDDKPKLEDASPEVQWIYNSLSTNYYWNSAVRAAEPDFSLPYDEFLEEMLINLDSAYDVEASGNRTIDGYYRDNTRHLYSWVDRSRATRAGDIYTTFGFDVFFFARGTSVEVLVSNVLPNGPAYNAGLRRGMWITRYNGSAITTGNYSNIWYDIYHMRANSMQLTIKNRTNPITVNAAAAEVTPIYLSKVITASGSKKVGYFVYNEFERGNGFKFDGQMRNTVFQSFKNAGVTELILDLRYNPGGYVSSCQVLTSLIADGSPKPVFAKLMYANGNTLVQQNPYVLNYLTEANSLKLKKVYVLITGDSASASEMVISSLRGIDVNVILIGEQSNGKNVGMDPFYKTEGGYSYEMWPITFKIKNAKDFCDYATGFTPNYYIDEFREWQGTIYELGDERERLLQAALTHINTGTLTPDPKTRSIGSDRMQTPSIPNRGGAKMTPEDRQTE